MHWQFGGNLEPVQIICEVDWTECPRAIVNYIWSEIVTDVVDCLTNEGIVWRVFVVSFVCIILLRTIYNKTRRMRSVALDKQILNKIGYKVEDLELKLNILTYKMQYGTWPLPHEIHASNFKKSLRNIRLTLSNPNDRNDWIKRVLLSPQKTDSCASYGKHNYPSTHHLIELFDAKKKLYPCVRRDVLSMKRDNTKSSRTNSDKSLRKSSTRLEMENQREHKVTKSENLEEHRDAVSLSPFPKKRHARSSCKMYRDSKYLTSQKVPRPCEKFTKTMDECKWYLKELHNSNKSLGLICSSTDISNDSSIKDTWPETQMYHSLRNLIDEDTKCKENNDANKAIKHTNTVQEVKIKGTETEQQSSDHYFSATSTVSPVLKLVDKRLLPSKLNFGLCTEMLPRQSLMNSLVPSTYKRKKLAKTSQNTLYEVKKKLESLHNVLRTYDIQNPRVRSAERQHENNNNDMYNICQNVVDTLASITTEIENINEKKRSKVSFDLHNKNDHNEIVQPIYNSIERCETDETTRSSDASARNCSNIDTFHNTDKSNRHFSNKQDDRETINDVEYSECSNSIHCQRIPERVKYALSGELLDEEANEKKTIEKKYSIESNQTELLDFDDSRSTPMDTEEDVMIISPTSSRTEFSRESEFDDKPTAELIQEALQFKQALLSRVELKDSYTMENDDLKNSENESVTEYCEWSKNNKLLQSKLLDIITEEQSISSSTEKTSRTHIFMNVKREEDVINQRSPNRSAIENNNVISKSYNDSKNLLDSSSEYLSFCNIINGRNGNDKNVLHVSQNSSYQENDPHEVTSNVKIQYLNTNNVDKVSDEKLVQGSSSNYFNSIQSETLIENTDHNDIDSKESDKYYLLEIQNINELINQNISDIRDHIESFSQHSQNKSFQNPEFPKQCTVTSNNQEHIIENEELKLVNDNEYTDYCNILKCNPNLTLKRQLGVCSLIENAVSGTYVKNEAEVPPTYGNMNSTLESLSQSEDKQNSASKNVMHDPAIALMNNKIDPSVIDPLVTNVSTDKFMNKKDIHLQWQATNNDSYDDYENAANIGTVSLNTITLHKSNDIVDMITYDARELPYNQNVHSAEEYETAENEEEKNMPSRENCSVCTDRERVNNEIELSKSNSKLVSQRSSVYFTDEASSSIMKLNNTHSGNLNDYLNSNLCTNKRAAEEKTANLAHVEHTRSDVLDTECSLDNAIFNSNINENDNTSLIMTNENFQKKISSVSYIESRNTESTNELEKTEIIDSQIDLDSFSNNAVWDTKASTSYNSSSKTETSNINQNIFSSNISSYQMSPRTANNQTPTDKGTAIKSQSQENYTFKSDKTKKSLLQNVKGLRTSISHTTSAKVDSNINLTQLKTKDLSAEPRQSAEYNNNNNNNNVHKKRSRSQVNIRTNESSHTTSRPCESSVAGYAQVNRDVTPENKPKHKVRSKSLIPTPKSSSKSCIPILKSRLEAARRTESEIRPKSPMRGPLTVTMLWRDNLCNKNSNVTEEIIQSEGASKNNDKCVREMNTYVSKAQEEQTHTDKHSLTRYDTPESAMEPNISKYIVPQERLVIYVNIFTKYDNNATRIVDPNKFLEYVHNRELSDKNNLSVTNTCEKKVPVVTTEKEENSIRKVVTIVSSVVNGNDLRQNKFADSSVPKPKTVSTINALSNGPLKNLCFLTVEQREIDVTAKPSVKDTSTSISDLQDISDTSKTALSKFQICGTPKELNNEEYVALLEILNQEPNFVHLQELQSLCKKLVSEY